ncbi:hypothetical protein PHMEG_00014161 [Phytophthora megakarya]|uniref:DUF7869 domain-containing protein n=1 Tax=Phytophthora megakarya TaxID=4795 RepID=A0A225W4Z5_9STRA|nr:hypothetical protein PHMEG_00014161 [Phytophthora megakarya]
MQPHEIPRTPTTTPSPDAASPPPFAATDTTAEDDSADEEDESAEEDDESDEPDDSEDEDMSEDENEVDEEEVSTAESAVSDADEEEDISINLIEVDLQQRVASLIQADKPEKLTSMLGVLMQTDTVERHRGEGNREKFHYYLPLVGKVCRPMFADCLGVTPLTIQRYKKRVREGNIAAKAHGNTLNKHASAIDLVWLVKWFKEFAEEVGEVVPVRVRIQKTVNGTVKKYYSSELYTLLPATFTWDAIYEEMHTYVETIRIRSRMRGGATAEQTEELGRHTLSAREMRWEYNKDKAFVKTDDGKDWYFCSLVAVSVFGIFYENDGKQTNYIYDESVSGKGSEQINSMLQHFINTVLVPAGKKRLIVYADNCSGQNKNNYVIKFLLAQAHMEVFERVDYKFFVKGHTKNSCDCGFGHIRKHLARTDCWTLNHVVNEVKNAASSNVTVHISREDGFFKSYKPLRTELYKTLVGVQQFQIFSMDSTKPGVVICKKSPNSTAVEKDLRRKVDGHLTEGHKVTRMFSGYLETMPAPPLNAEKIDQMHRTIRPYVPDEFHEDPIYAAPSKQQGDSAKAAKKARREHRAAMARAANQDKRGRQEDEDVVSTSTKRKKTQ